MQTPFSVGVAHYIFWKELYFLVSYYSFFVCDAALPTVLAMAGIMFLPKKDPGMALYRRFEKITLGNVGFQLL